MNWEISWLEEISSRNKTKKEAPQQGKKLG
jgi:hypothetical protein